MPPPENLETQIIANSHIMRKKLLIAVSFLGAVGAVALLWPTGRYDMSRVHPALRELATPYQSVRSSYYLDGGSVGITIVDRDGHRLQLALPVSGQRGRPYPRLFVGATSSSTPGAVEVEFTEDTRRMLISIIEQHQNGSHDAVLLALRGAPRDYARTLSRAAVSFYQRVTR